jgi:hypothetical protein
MMGAVEAPPGASADEVASIMFERAVSEIEKGGAISAAAFMPSRGQIYAIVHRFSNVDEQAAAYALVCATALTEHVPWLVFVAQAWLLPKDDAPEGLGHYRRVRDHPKSREAVIVTVCSPQAIEPRIYSFERVTASDGKERIRWRGKDGRPENTHDGSAGPLSALPDPWADKRHPTVSRPASPHAAAKDNTGAEWQCVGQRILALSDPPDLTPPDVTLH